MTPFIRNIIIVLVVILLVLGGWLLLHQIWVDENCTLVLGTEVCK